MCFRVPDFSRYLPSRQRVVELRSRQLMNCSHYSSASFAFMRVFFTYVLFLFRYGSCNTRSAALQLSAFRLLRHVICCCFSGRCRTRSAALKLEADLDATCLEKGWTPLMYAASKGNLVAVNDLLEAGCRVNQLSNPTGERDAWTGCGTGICHSGGGCCCEGIYQPPDTPQS